MKFENTLDFNTRLSLWKDIINQDPIKTEPSQDGEYRLVPIAALEPDLQDVFNGAIDIVIDEYKQMYGHVSMRITLSVFHPVYERFFNYSGIAAVLIETQEAGNYKGTVKVNTAESLKVAIAACYSEALKNAAKRIGNRFGQRVNRGENRIVKPGSEIANDMIAKIPTEKKTRKPYGKRTKAEVTTAKKTIKNKVQMP